MAHPQPMSPAIAQPLPDPALFLDRPWFAVIAKPRQEEWALENLLAQDYAAWLPMCLTVKADRHRWQSRHKRQMLQVVAPLFPRYLFAGSGENQDIETICNTRGVCEVVRTRQGYPVAVHGRALTDLHGRLSEDGGALDLRPGPKFTKGERLKVTEGPFAGLQGPCILASEERVTLLLDIMGRGVHVRLTAEQVERAVGLPPAVR